MQFFYRFIRNESGGTSIEYAVIAVFIGVAIAGVAQAIGTNLGPIFVKVAAGLH